MCTVTYLPKSNGCIITSNRDESKTRPAALSPETYLIDKAELQYPKDPVGKGSWIVSGNNATVCLFNGAFTSHQKKESYKHSRGLIPLHYFRFDSVQNFISNYDFAELEPFSLVIYHDCGLHELIWDENRLHHEVLNVNVPKIWASSTLYEPEVIKARKQYFNNWLQSPSEITQEDIINFHKSGDKNNRDNGMLIDRTNVSTVSITSVEKNEQCSIMIYEDLKANKTFISEIRV